MENSYYPIMMDLNDKDVVVIGGGKVAYRRVKGLISSSANIRVISKDFIQPFKHIDYKKLNLVRREYRKGDFNNAQMVFICTDDKNTNTKCLSDARELNILCNTAESQEACDFILPSKIEKGGLVIGITTSGNSPTLSAKIKDEIEQALPNNIDEYIEGLGIIRRIVKNEIDDLDMRKKILNAMVSKDIIDRISNKDIDDIYRELMSIYIRIKGEI